MIRCPLALLAGFAPLLTLPAQIPTDDAARRLASVVSVTVSEYGKAVDSLGHVISADEYGETAEFLAQAREIAARLPGAGGARARATLDTLSAAAAAKRAPAVFDPIAQRVLAALGAAGTLEMPATALDVALGQRSFDAHCVSCHGPRGLGDGPAAKTMTPPPPAIGSRIAMTEASPALLYHVITVGVPGTKMQSWAAELPAHERWATVAYVQSLRATPADVRAGETLFLARCAGCDAAVIATVTSFDWQAQRSDADLLGVVAHGLAGTTMAPATVAAEDAPKIVAYLRSVAPLRTGAPVTAVADAAAAEALRNVRVTLGQALDAAQAGRSAEARDRAFDAYIAFEPLEVPAAAKDPQAVARMETRFAAFKSAIKQNDLVAARAERDAIDAMLPEIAALTHQASNAWAAFLQSFLIILREGFEAILVIGAIATFLIKTGNQQRLRSIWWGAGLGIVASVATAVILQTVLRAVPASRDLLEGITMLVAVAVLFSVSYWLISKVDAARWQKFIRDSVASALEKGGGKALAFAAFLAVYREGAEVALFYQALLGEAHQGLAPILAGIGVGAVALAIIFTLFHRFGVRLPLRPFFAATSALLYAMAFVMAGRGVHELQDANVVSATHLHGWPQVDGLGIFPTVETIGAQTLLLVLAAVALTIALWRSRTTPEPAPAVRSAAAAPAPSSPTG